MKVFTFLCVLVIAVMNLGAKDTEVPATLILYNGNIITMVQQQPKAEAIVISKNAIIYVGSNDEALTMKNEKTKLIDLKDATVLPGLSDAHMHLISLGESLIQLNFAGTTSKEEIIAKVKERIAKLPSGKWLIGRGWDQNDWQIKEFPHYKDLDAVSPRNPVYLRRIDGHAAWINSRAMELAHINEQSKDPAGGSILREAGTNKPTGVLIDNAMDLVGKIIPSPTKDEIKNYVIGGMKHCAKDGLTMVHDAGASLTDINIYKELLDEDKLPIRLYVMIDDTPETLKYYFARKPEIGLKDSMLTIRAIKTYADGAMGSRGALFFKPYDDDSGNSGLAMNSQDRMEELSGKAFAKGWQLCTHAIGDKAVYMTLQAYGKALKGHNDARFRIEHAQVVRPDDIELFTQFDILASMQPVHATSDMYWAEKRIGAERIKGAYAWRNLLNQHVIIAAGSDAPVEDINPLLGIYAAVTRKDLQGFPEKGWYPEQTLSIMEAIKIFTETPAYAAFMEKNKGFIKKGYLADITVLDKDISTLPPEEIPKTKVIHTIVNGKIVY
jgi:predicted amidohydrolase YtcJ